MKLKSYIILAVLSCGALGVKAELQPEVKIGVIAGLSGEYAQVFQNFVDGVTLAHEQHRAKGALPTVRLIFEDDEFRAAKGLSAYQRLSGTDKIDALINGSSMTIGAIYPLVSKGAMPVPQLGEETEEPRDDNVLQIMPGNVEIERALGVHVAAKCPKDSPLFYSVHPTMERFAKAFRAGFAGTPTVYELDPATSDLKSVAVRALASSPRCAVLLMFPAQGVQLVRELRNFSRTPLQLVFDGNLQSGISEYRTILGSLELVRDAIVAVLPSNASADFTKAYQERFGKPPGVTADMGYDAFLTLVQHYQTERRAWVNAIKSSRFEGASGTIEFDEVGVRRPEFRITTAQEFFGTP